MGESYAAWAPSYDLVPNLLIEAEEPCVHAILDRLPTVETAIDVGTGTGRHARYLARQGVQVVGYDGTPEMLAVARSRAEAEGLANVHFEQLTIGKKALPAATESVDLLVCALMLCHLPDLRAVVDECVRVVRPGGYLIISDFHPVAIEFGWRSAFPMPSVHYYMPTTSHTREGYLNALTENGCQILDLFDVAVHGQPYGDVSEAAMVEKGMPPFCLIMSAQKAG